MLQQIRDGMYNFSCLGKLSAKCPAVSLENCVLWQSKKIWGGGVFRPFFANKINCGCLAYLKFFFFNLYGNLLAFLGKIFFQHKFCLWKQIKEFHVNGRKTKINWYQQISTKIKIIQYSQTFSEIHRRHPKLTEINQDQLRFWAKNYFTWRKKG